MTSLELVGKVTTFFRQKLVQKKTLRTIITHLRKDIGINPTSRPFEMLELPDNVFRLVIPSQNHGHLIRFLIDALNNSIGFTYGYLRFSPKGLGIDVDVSPRRG